jgi:hypothetical protein
MIPILQKRMQCITQSSTGINFLRSNLFHDYSASGATGPGHQSADRGEGGPARQAGVRGYRGQTSARDLLDQTGNTLHRRRCNCLHRFCMKNLVDQIAALAKKKQQKIPNFEVLLIGFIGNVFKIENFRDIICKIRFYF